MTKTLQALVEWVELGREPEAIIVERGSAATLPARSFLLCAEPARAVYRGTGKCSGADGFESVAGAGCCRQPAYTLSGSPCNGTQP